MNNIEELQEDHNPQLEVEGIVINQFNAQAKLPGELVAELKGEGFPVIENFLTSSVKMRESHHEMRPLIYLAPSHKLTQAYVDLHNQLEKNVKKRRRSK